MFHTKLLAAKLEGRGWSASRGTWEPDPFLDVSFLDVSFLIGNDLFCTAKAAKLEGRKWSASRGLAWDVGA